MSARPDSARGRWRRPLAFAALAAGAALWIWAATRLWRTTVPDGLALPDVDLEGTFGGDFLARSASYERFLSILGLLAAVVTLLVLWLYARRGHRLMRESAAGPIGTGMMLGMLGLGVVWLTQVPFTIAALWWQRRHDVAEVGYAEALLESFLGLGGTFTAISFALLVTMFLARVLRGWWWLAAPPVFVGLALLGAYLSPYLIPDTHPLRDPDTRADARALALAEGVSDVDVVVQEVGRHTTAPNAEATGFGGTQRVILWDTLLDGRFERDEVRSILAHEMGHLSRDHILKSVGLLVLFLVPATGLIALATRRRGGLARPEAVPLALFVLVALSVATQPLTSAAGRRMEAEADWAALEATRDPAAFRDAFRELALASLADPDPPAWTHLLGDSHPTIEQRIAMSRAWEARER